MSNYQHISTRSFESRVVQGCRVVLKNPSIQRRADLSRQLAPLNEEITERAKRIEKAQAALNELIQERDTFETLTLYPIVLRWGVSSIENLEIDGHPATVEDLVLGDAPDGFAQEIIDVLSGKIDLSSAGKDDGFRDATPETSALASTPSGSVVN